MAVLFPVIPTLSARSIPPGPVIRGYSHTIIILCEATAGDLPISYSWSNSTGHIVPPGDTNGSIMVTVNDLEDYDDYICTATNEFGRGQIVFSITEPGMPVLCDKSPRYTR